MTPTVNNEYSKLIALLNNEEIRASITALNDALQSSAATDSLSPPSEVVTYRHDCHKYYKYHRDSPKRYSMLVTSVDPQKTDEQAFCGRRLCFSSEHMIPKNSVVVEVCGSAYTAYRITGDYAKKEIDTRFRGSLHRLILAVAEAIQKQ